MRVKSCLVYQKSIRIDVELGSPTPQTHSGAGPIIRNVTHFHLSPLASTVRNENTSKALSLTSKGSRYGVQSHLEIFLYIHSYLSSFVSPVTGIGKVVIRSADNPPTFGSGGSKREEPPKSSLKYSNTEEEYVEGGINIFLRFIFSKSVLLLLRIIASQCPIRVVLGSSRRLVACSLLI